MKGQFRGDLGVHYRITSYSLQECFGGEWEGLRKRQVIGVGSEQKVSTQETEAWVLEDRAGPGWEPLLKASWSLWDFGQVRSSTVWALLLHRDCGLLYRGGAFTAVCSRLFKISCGIGICLNVYRFVWFQLFEPLVQTRLPGFSLNPKILASV